MTRAQNIGVRIQYVPFMEGAIVFLYICRGIILNGNVLDCSRYLFWVSLEAVQLQAVVVG